MKKPYVQVVAALIRDGGKILIFQRPADKARGLKWEFPGGKTEPGETAAQALARECREELGVEIEVGGEVAATTHSYPDVKIRLTVMEAKIMRGDIKLSEHVAVRRVTYAECAGYELCAADYKILTALRKSERRAGNKKTGRRGEKAAAKYLKRHGYKIVKRNWRTPFCEVDIIAKQQDVFVFCEVKTRENDFYGAPNEAVDKRKKSLYVRAARLFSAGKRELEIRFDVMEVYKGEITHLENAFGADILN